MNGYEFTAAVLVGVTLLWMLVDIGISIANQIAADRKQRRHAVRLDPLPCSRGARVQQSNVVVYRPGERPDVTPRACPAPYDWAMEGDL